MSTANIFNRYKQLENDYTNGFVSLLRLAAEARSCLLNQLFDELRIPSTYKPTDYFVLRGIAGYADAEVSATDFCIWFETKICSGALRDDQIRQHLAALGMKHQTCQYLVLLTPDDSNSRYINGFSKIDPRIRHLEWRRVYELLELSTGHDRVFSVLTRQFQAHIQETIFEQDRAGGILKVSFGDKSEVYSDSYLDEFREWPFWGTPREYKSLDGTGRKLLLYDPDRKGITLEAEIAKIVENPSDVDYPWRNEFVPGSIHIFDPPITLDTIRTMEGFRDFGVHRKDRCAFRNLTHSQYRLLVSPHLESRITNPHSTAPPSEASAFEISENKDMLLDTDAILRDFRKAVNLAGVALAEDEIEVKSLPAPHQPPRPLTSGEMAVYVFLFQGRVLKVGKVGPKSQARYVSQHYNAGSAPSTLAASLLKRGPEVGLPAVDSNEMPEWIKKNTDRINFIMKAERGMHVLTMLEAFLQCRLRPVFEGFPSQETPDSAGDHNFTTGIMERMNQCSG